MYYYLKHKIKLFSEIIKINLLNTIYINLNIKFNKDGLFYYYSNSKS